MKILILNDYAFVEGGAGKVAIESAIALSKNGHEVKFFSAVGPVSDLLEKSGIKEIICLNQDDILSSKNKVSASISGIKNKDAVKKLEEVLEAWQPDIAHIHGVSKALSWAVVSYLTKREIPVVYTLHDFGLLCPNMGLYDFRNARQCELYKSDTYFKCLLTNCDKRSYGQKIWRWARFIYTRNILKVIKKVSGYVAVSSFVMDFYRKYLPENSIVKIINNPVEFNDYDNFYPGNVSEQEQDNIFQFLFIGRLSEEKGIRLLLGAIKDIYKDKGKNNNIEVKIKFVIIGQGELENLCRETSEQIGTERLEMLKWQDEESKARIMLESDAIILPSLVMETAGIALFEAKKFGVAAIASDHGAFRDFIEGGRDGLLFEPGSKDSLVLAINQIIDSPGLAKTLGDNARKNYMEYDGKIESHIKKLEQFYIEIINSR